MIGPTQFRCRRTFLNVSSLRRMVWMLKISRSVGGMPTNTNVPPGASSLLRLVDAQRIARTLEHQVDAARLFPQDRCLAALLPALPVQSAPHCRATSNRPSNRSVA